MYDSLVESIASGLVVGAQDRLTPDQRAEYDRCKADPVYWFDNYVWTYNPKLPSSERWIRFQPFPKQREYIAWIRDREDAREDGVVEKSRDVGMTWLNVGILVHRWLFERDFKGAVGSRKEGLVDKLGDPDTIFEKGRMILRKLPNWMLPCGFNENEHLLFCRFVNPENGSVITGEAGDNIGRGGRNSLYFVDEAAFIERSEKVDAALSQNADCKIYVSTPNGQGNSFYRKRFSGAYPVFTSHWRDDPRKDDAWYASQVAKHDPVTVAQEIDIDYTASVDGIAIPAKYVRAAVGLDLPKSASGVAGGDVAAGGKNKTVFVPRFGPVVDGIQHWNESNTTTTAHNFADAAHKAGVKSLAYDAVGVGAGVRSAFDLMEGLGFQPVALLSGSPPSDDLWPDGKTSKERFINLRAELWFKARDRFEKTYEHVNGIKEHPLEELITIPNHPELIAQLSMPLMFRTASGKIQIESKEQMTKRGVQSPDFADGLVYSLYEPKARFTWDAS